MAHVVTTVDDLFADLHQRLQLSRHGGLRGQGRPLCNRDHPIDRAMVGHFNPLRDHRITILGQKETHYLRTLPQDQTQQLCEHIASEPLSLIVIGDGHLPPTPLLAACERCETPIWTTPITSHELVREIQYHVNGHLTVPIILHGVLMDVLGIGVLITGDPGVGKSEVALELVSRGNQLVADDAPEFRRAAPDTITGTCPETLKHFMEVRGLGVLDIRAMYGDGAIKYRQDLRLIVRLEPMDDEQLRRIDRLQGNRGTQTVLGVPIPKVTLPVTAGRDLAVLLETAVRNQLLLFKGYDASERFIRMQAEQLHE